MDESTLVRTFEMLVERLSKVEDAQAGVLVALREAAEASGAPWLPGRIHCGFPVRILKRMDVPVTSPDTMVSVRLEWHDSASSPSLDNRVYWDWLFNGKETFDARRFPEEVREALRRVRLRQEELDAEEEGNVYDPRCEEVRLFPGQPSGKMRVSEWVMREVARAACPECEFVMLNDTDDVVALRFPAASARRPVGLSEIMAAVSKVLEAFGATLGDVVSAELKATKAHLWLLYLLMLNPFSRDTDGREEFKRLARYHQRALSSAAKADGGCFGPWSTKLQRWSDE